MANIQEVELINYEEMSQLKAIGSGSFGTVFRANWKGQLVAVKEFHSSDQQLVDKEINQLCRVRPHENIVRFLGISRNLEDSVEMTFLVMEYADGGSLYDFLHRPPKRPYSAAHALSWLRQCAAGMVHLHTMHEKKILHRDLKPANLLLFNNYTTLKIGDFGTVVELKTLMTSQRGSPIWMAPEVFLGQKYTEKCDVYSWGIMLWEVICRKMPYDEFENQIELLQAVVKGARPPPIPLCPAVLTDLMTRCWDKEPNMRPSMVEILNLISNVSDRFNGANIPISADQVAPDDNMDAVIQVMKDTLTRQ